VIGYRHGRHLEGFDPLDELLDLAGAIEHGVVGVQVEMNELRLRHSGRFPWSLPLFYSPQHLPVSGGGVENPTELRVTLRRLRHRLLR